MDFSKIEMAFNSTGMRSIAEDYGISLAVVFGSVAKGTADADSDIDIAVLLENLSGKDLLKLRFSLIDAFEDMLKTRCDVILLNEAPTELKYQVIKYGKVVYEKGKSYNAFFSKTLNEYFDFKYFSDRYYAKIKESFMRGDKFG